MSSQPTASSPSSTTDPRGAKSLLVVASLAMVLVFFAAAVPAPIRAAWDEFALRIQLQSEPQSASPAKLSDHEIEEIANLPAQQQAERLLERAVNHYDGALELIGKSVDNWFGQLELQGQLSSLLTTALNSNDLRVRAAALEIELAEKLVDLEDAFRQWRFRHATTVERVIGMKRGTGGTSGVGYLRRVVEVELFPELWRARTAL